MKKLLLPLLIASSTAHSFTYTDNWSIPDNQVCDDWESISVYKSAINPVIMAGESRKINIKVPNNSITATIRYQGFASKPSKLITDIGYNYPFYIEPRLGSHVSKLFNQPTGYVYIYQNHISTEVNMGHSTMSEVSASFKLTKTECDKRKGTFIPPKVVVPDLEVKPIILRDDFSFNLNQIDLGNNNIYAIQFEYSHISNGSYYFRTTSVRPVTVDDYDKDTYTIVSGDCNDDDPKINPNKYNCN